MPGSTILYLDGATVRAAMPPVEIRIQLAERTMLALIADAQLPPKLGVDARPAGSFGSGRISHRVSLAHEDEIDAELTGWLHDAYDVAAPR